MKDSIVVYEESVRQEAVRPDGVLCYTGGDPALAQIINILREAREEFELSFGADGCLNRRIDAARSIA